MRKLLSCFLVLAIATSAYGQAPPNPPPSTPTVILPIIPAPVPNPTNPSVLGPNELYVVEASAPVIVLTSPAGILKVTPAAGPLMIRGQFVDGKGNETRTFKGPSLYIIEAAGSGTAELLVVPSMDPKTVIRQMLTTTIAPPPVPPPGPGPGPVDPVVQAMSDALKADGQPVGIAAALARIYRTVATSGVPNTSLVTYADLFRTVAAVQDAAVDKTKIPSLRKVIGQQIVTALGTNQTAPIDRDLATKTLNAIAAQLEGVK